MSTSKSCGLSVVSPSNPDLARAECWYWIRKAQARFFAGDYAAAVDSSLKAQTAAVGIAVKF